MISQVFYSEEHTVDVQIFALSDRPTVPMVTEVVPWTESPSP